MQLTKHWAVGLDDYVIDLAWSPRGDQLAAASASGVVLIVNGTDGAVKHELHCHADGTNAIGWRPDGQALASGGQDGAVKLWDTQAGQHVATAELGKSWVEHVSWRPTSVADDATGNPGSVAAPLLAVAAGKQLTFLNADASVRHAFKPAPKTISALAWHPKGGCAAVSYFGGVELWDADDCVLQNEFPYANGIQTLVWSPDARWLVSGNQDPSVHLWLPETNGELHMSGYEGKVKTLSFDHTSRWLATGGGREACIWDCSGAGPEGREPVMLPHDTKIAVVAYQHTHGLLATASEDGTLILWSPERKQPLRATVKMPSMATKLEWSPDDRYLAVGTAKGIVYVLQCQP